MSIVVTTPTGHVGSRVVRLLVQAGVRPRLLLRDPSRLDAETLSLVEAVPGDLTDATYVRESITGADTVLWVDPTPHFGPDPIDTSLRTAEPLIEAARAGDVNRVVLLSSIGAEKRHGVGHIDALGGIEERLDATDIDVLHVRCAYFFTNLLFEVDGLRDGVLSTAFEPDRPMPWADPRDIGEVIAARLLNPAWHGHLTQAVHGPRDLSFRQVAAILTEALGREIRLQPVTDAQVRDALTEAGLPPSAVDAIAGMSAGSADVKPEQPRDVVTTTPGTLEAWAYSVLRPVIDQD
ncbi:NAD(P)H-binding protein [Stackebrandtia nassauensis]|uniref:NmrA family protein n=1 Tax=Stackebrandtia nassauensis (strain DSM 44728 / CIP 108903 / NRRL B-16338 / NBRC 102104 / LLR-40K-21) TaxID=446470 RepID=D3Q2I3_STANL|nr:NAD(P)H-binding protein [Stackebrandtia nassauensis]ADD43916.1 NmrA family protein [Stackebrandtia nassauensis DSM 44728]